MTHSAVFSTLAESQSICLVDVSPKDKPWDKHKAYSERVSLVYQGTVYDSFHSRMQNCSGWLQFGSGTDPVTGEQRLKLKSAQFCRVRFCPVCQWRRSLMWVARFLKKLPAIRADNPGCRFIFLTLTVRNCQLSELRETLAYMNKSWQRLVQRKEFPAIGWAKSVEVTRRPYGEVHPHFHCLLMVKSTYFSTNKYLSQLKWQALWRDCLRAGYDPVVDVRAVKPKAPKKNSDPNLDNGLEDISKSIVETFKYSVKPQDLLGDGIDNQENREWLEELTAQLRNTRSIALGGEFKKYLSEDEPEDLVHGADNLEELDELVSNIYFGWREHLLKYIYLSE